MLRKVEAIIREEMNRAGAFELLMPTRAARRAVAGVRAAGTSSARSCCALRDRHERSFCYGPTHEEVITDIARRELKSYRQLPVNFYQIQTKFRDEIRPALRRDARARVHDEGRVLVPSRRRPRSSRATRRCTTRTRASSRGCSLRFRAVRADTGSIGGNASQEFHVLADSGEDAIAFSDADDYAANLEMAEARAAGDARARRRRDAREGGHAGHADDRRADARSSGVDAARLPEDAAGRGQRRRRGRARRARRPRVERRQGAEAAGRRLARSDGHAEQVRAATGCEPGFIGPVGLALQGLCRPRGRARWPTSSAARNERDAAPHRRELGPRPAGARGGRHPQCRGRRPEPLGRGRLDIARGIEVGHIFQLGRKYSEAMGADGARRSRASP